MSSSDAPDWLSNKRLFRWHGWLGLNLGLLLFVICFSGTVAVFSWEIDWLIDPAMQAEADSVNWTAVEEGAKDAYPNHFVSFIHGPRHDGFAALAYATDPTGRSVKLWVHPETGAVQKRGSFWTVQRFFRSFHRRMFAPNPFGLLWVTFFAFVMLASAATGLLFYRGWYRHLFRWRWSDVRLFFSDGHRLAGVWSLAFAAVIVATGVWYMVELVAPRPGPAPPDLSKEALVERGPTPDVLPLGEQVERAKEAFPEAFRVQDVIPGTASRPTHVRGYADAWLARPRANTVRLDPVTGDVLSVQRATEASVYHRIADMADPLHFGTFGGLWVQALWFVFGLVLSSLMLTGGWLWHLRAEKKARAAGADTGHPRWGYVAAAVPVVVLLASGVFGYLEVEQNYRMSDAPRRVEVGERSVGPWTARVMRMSEGGSGDASYRVYFAGANGDPANLKAASLNWAGRPDSTAVSKTSGAPITDILSASPPSAEAELAVSATEWGGPTHRATVPARPSGDGGDRWTQARLPVPPVPAAVWWIVGIFSVLTLGIVAAWLVVAWNTARRREDGQETAPSGDGSRDGSPHATPVAADLPTSS
jgi:uncharacterized iron-regulated membrane protein